MQTANLNIALTLKAMMPNLAALLALAGTMALVPAEWKPEYAAAPQVV